MFTWSTCIWDQIPSYLFPLFVWVRCVWYIVVVRSVIKVYPCMKLSYLWAQVSILLNYYYGFIFYMWLAEPSIFCCLLRHELQLKLRLDTSLLFVVSVSFSYYLLYLMLVSFSSWREGVIAQNYEGDETKYVVQFSGNLHSASLVTFSPFYLVV